MTQFLEVVLRGLGSGSIYALLALGFVIIYKSTGVISFAQPAMMLTGATITSYVGPALGVMLFTGFSFFMSMAVAALLTAALALVIERGAIRPMVGRPAFVVAMGANVRHADPLQQGRRCRPCRSTSRPTSETNSSRARST